MATFFSGFVVGFTAVWQLVFVTLDVVPLIVVIRVIYTITSAKFSSKSQEALSKAGNIVEQAPFSPDMHQIPTIRGIFAFVIASSTYVTRSLKRQSLVLTYYVARHLIGKIKTGVPCMSEHLTKYNQLYANMFVHSI